MHQHSIKTSSNISTDESILELLKNPETVVALGVSGGKDSDAMTLETVQFLKKIGFRGEICLIHSHLGLIEHAASLPQCERLSQKTGIELFVVEPPRSMLEVWEHRWSGIVDRFIKLERVKIITPWSNAQWRFCTKATKTAPLTQFLKRKYPNKTIINASGIRREESSSRAKRPVSRENPDLASVKLKTSGRDWFPIIDYKIEDVWQVHRKFNFPRHEAYDRGLSRVSCAFCVLASSNDIKVSLRDPRNRQSFQRIVELEIKSGFSFRDQDWLADHGRALLTPLQLDRLAQAKELMQQRKKLDQMISPELFLSRDGQLHPLTFEQAGTIADYRKAVGALYQITPQYLTPEGVLERYGEVSLQK